MSYVRPAKKKEVVTWLLARGFAENCGPNNDGYCLPDAEELASALIEEWDLVGFFSSPS